LLGAKEGFAGGVNLGTERDNNKARVKAFIGSVFLSIPAYHRPFLTELKLRLPA